MSIPKTHKDFVKDICALLETHTYNSYNFEHLYTMYLELLSKEKLPEPIYKVGEYVYVDAEKLGYGFDKDSSEKKDYLFHIERKFYVIGIIEDVSIYKKLPYEIKVFYIQKNGSDDFTRHQFSESSLLRMSEYCKNPLLETD